MAWRPLSNQKCGAPRPSLLSLSLSFDPLRVSICSSVCLTDEGERRLKPIYASEMARLGGTIREGGEIKDQRDIDIQKVSKQSQKGVLICPFNGLLAVKSVFIGDQRSTLLRFYNCKNLQS